MAEKNLPIKLIMQRSTDIYKNQGGGSTKFFGDVTPELKKTLIEKLEHVGDFYADVFSENEHVPAIAKITVKDEAIAKSHKPDSLCRNCPIIGTEDLNQIYIKVKKNTIEETIQLVSQPTSKQIRANMTAILDITPISADEKVSSNLREISDENFEYIKNRVKIKIFDFNNEYDNEQIWRYVTSKLDELNLSDSTEVITYGDSIKYIKLEVKTQDDIIKLASINGVKSVDFFQEYSTPKIELGEVDLQELFDMEFVDSDVRIGIIDGGISDLNPHLAPYIIAREEYVPAVYRNPNHATFIASTIQYGNILNNLKSETQYRFKFVDVVAIPNSDAKFGPIDSIHEEDLMTIINEVMEKHSETTKIWNISLGLENKVCNGSMSDLGIFLDYIQDKYEVQLFVSSGNINQLPVRSWPPENDIGEHDRLISPADSIRAITVGSVALYDSDDSYVKTNEPSAFSRRGPGANYTVKPEIVDYGGNFSKNYSLNGLGMNGLDPAGNTVESNGTSYSTPRAVQKFAAIYEEMAEPDLLLAKAMLIHSARMNSRNILDEESDHIKYYGFGIPPVDVQEILQCSEDEVTLIFKQKVTEGVHLEMYDFPYPKSLIRNGRFIGEIGMTLAYLPPLDKNHGREYCRSNIDVSFGTYSFNQTGSPNFSGQVPLEARWDEKLEKQRVENGFKWSPNKSYHRKLVQGISVTDGWKIRVDMTARNGATIPFQEFVLIITIKDPNSNDIYTEISEGLRERGYITNNLETRYQIRQRQ